MAAIDGQVSTGLAGLDRVLCGVMAGDNIVWHVDSVDDYLPLVQPFVRYACDRGRRLVYFHFARHHALITEGPGVQVEVLDPAEGFELFLSAIHDTIERSGRGAFYVFDCLSDLAADWYNDQMLGNFFSLTCPFLYDLETVAYFALLRGHHSFHATAPILDTTQIFSEVYEHRNELYIRPLKAQQRYSSTMYMLHVWRGNNFLPVTDSVTTSDILTHFPWAGLNASDPRLDVWNRTFLEAEEVLEAQRQQIHCAELVLELLDRSLRMIVSRDERVVRLARQHLTLSDVLAIKRRMIGTGLIGGKTVGVLLARAILKNTRPRWNELLEIHDSFFIGSDVFYTFLVRNGCWWVRAKQKNVATFLEGAETARRRILRGDFPTYILQQFSDMLDYFGQSPIIVRSSSLLEDNFGNAFAGKYDSVFCVNQGPRDKRLEDLQAAVRTIYASTMSERALNYRARRGLLDRDEQMALLVQRVSGVQQGSLFYPHMAGVGLSFNPYVWSEQIDPEAGMVRLVMGLGTRAVDRSDDDYTRVVSLSDAQRRPESNFDSVRQYSQKRIDVLDLEANQLTTRQFADLARQSPDLPLRLVASRDYSLEQRARERGMQNVFPWVLTFEQLLQKTLFVDDMRELLATLEDAYDYPVDVEFTRTRSMIGTTGSISCSVGRFRCARRERSRTRRRTSSPSASSSRPMARSSAKAVSGRSTGWCTLFRRSMGSCRSATGTRLPVWSGRSCAFAILNRTKHPAGWTGSLGNSFARPGRARPVCRDQHCSSALRGRQYARRPHSRCLARHALLQRPCRNQYPLSGNLSTTCGQPPEHQLPRATAEPPGRTAAGGGRMGELPAGVRSA